jgi:hypothetical protein
MLDVSPEEQAKTGEVPGIVQTANEEMTVFSAAFNADTIKNIDCCYNNIISLINFINFDYLGVLKEFDPKIGEYDFSRSPVFGNVYGSRLTDKIKDFLEVSFAVSGVQNWEQVIKILKQYRNDVIVINHAQWNRIVNRLHEIHKSGILEKIVRHIEKDPSWQFKPMIPNQHIAAQYLETKKTEVKTWLDTMLNSHKDSRKKSMLIDVFGNSEIQRTKFYTGRANEVYIKKGFEGFRFTDSLNYLLTFLIYEFNAETNDLYNTLLIRGEWIMRESYMEMSGNYHQLTELTNKITAFDCGFSDGGNYGSRLRTFILGTAPNNTHSRFVNSILANANEEALELINTGVGLIEDIGKTMQALSNDSRNASHTFIGDWQKLDNGKNSIADRIAASCTKINNFIRLMHFLIKDESSDVEYAAA